MVGVVPKLLVTSPWITIIESWLNKKTTRHIDRAFISTKWLQIHCFAGSIPTLVSDITICAGFSPIFFCGSSWPHGQVVGKSASQIYQFEVCLYKPSKNWALCDIALHTFTTIIPYIGPFKKTFEYWNAWCRRYLYFRKPSPRSNGPRSHSRSDSWRSHTAAAGNNPGTFAALRRQIPIWSPWRDFTMKNGGFTTEQSGVNHETCG